MRNVKKILQKRLFLTSSPAMLQKKNMTGLLYGHHVHTGCRFQCRVNKLLSISQGGYYGTWNSGADHLCRSYVHRRLPRPLRRQGLQVALSGSLMRTAWLRRESHEIPAFFVSASLRTVRLCRSDSRSHCAHEVTGPTLQPLLMYARTRQTSCCN